MEGGKAFIEDNATLKNNCTAAVSVGTNVEGGVVTMNGGLITDNVSAYSGRSDTGMAVTVLEGSTFIMNGGTISDNQTLGDCDSAPAIMANRGGVVVINGGTIENNSAAGSKGGAIHIQGGEVTINGGTIRNNNARGYGGIYVTNHSSFDRKWDGVLTINRGTISDDGNAIYLWSKGNIAGTGAYVRFSGSPTVQGRLYAVANGFANLDFKPIEVTGAFAPTQPVTLHSAFEYIVRQTMVQYADGVEADSAQFISLYDEYGYQKDTAQNQQVHAHRRDHQPQRRRRRQKVPPPAFCAHAHHPPFHPVIRTMRTPPHLVFCIIQHLARILRGFVAPRAHFSYTCTARAPQRPPRLCKPPCPAPALRRYVTDDG